MADPMISTDLAEIDERAAYITEYVNVPATVQQLAQVDVPALLAEVERLRTDLVFARDHAAQWQTVQEQTEADRDRAVEQAAGWELKAAALTEQRDDATKARDTAYTERDEARRELAESLGRRLYDDLNRVLDDALGTGRHDGAGEGMLADVRLVADRMRKAEASVAGWRGAYNRLAATTLRFQWAYESARRGRRQVRALLAAVTADRDVALAQLDGGEEPPGLLAAVADVLDSVDDGDATAEAAIARLREHVVAVASGLGS